MPTSQIRQAAVGMLGAHLANSCTNFKKQHEASGKSGFTIPITDRTRQMACCVAISGVSCPHRLFWLRQTSLAQAATARPNRHPEEDTATILPVSR